MPATARREHRRGPSASSRPARSKDLYYGLHVPHPTVREYQSTRVEVDAAERLTLSLDGVRMPGGPPLAVEVLDKVLRVKV